MTLPATDSDAPAAGRGVFVFNGGFLWQKRVRRILQLAGHPIRLGRPGPDDLIAVWGHSPNARRGESVAQATGAGILRVEDAFLRSLHPGRAGEPPLGLTIDRRAAHFDGSRMSDLEHLLATHPLDDTALLDRARGLIARLQEAHLTKYAAVDPDAPLPAPGYVLVIDQTRDDASVRLGGANAATFREMLYWAREENPGSRIVIKTHPETRAGFRPGYFADEPDAELLTAAVSPRALMEGAVAVYTVSSQFGFEAILAGHRPRVFGLPFYAGWGLTDDRHPLGFPGRRGRVLTRAQLAAAALVLYPRWYDPFHDRLCSAEDAVESLAARSRAWREDRHGWVGRSVRLWKRPAMQGFFGAEKPMRFSGSAGSRRDMSWAGLTAPEAQVVRVEDGFLRSCGLGANLVPPLSLALDDLGIYYDPTRESRLDRLIAARTVLRPDQQLRAERLIARLTRAGLTKYNLGGGLPDLPDTRRVLVVGQVEDDASIRLGAGAVRTNLGLLQAAREANPDACLIYKPHPDVEAGLRPGAVDRAEDWADVIARGSDPAALASVVAEVWTMTSLLGFEALMRGTPVVTLGAPFYAGWGLTRDLGPVPARRAARVTLAGLVHAALIDYPRYRDPVTGLPCPVEIAVDRLTDGTALPRSPVLHLLAKAQGLMASQAWLWR